jgi:hypothetical protein
MAAQLVEGVAETEVRHGVAGLEAGEPSPQRLVGVVVGLDCPVEQTPVERRRSLEQYPRGRDDLTGGRVAQAEERRVEARALPELSHLLGLQGREVDHLEAHDRAAGAGVQVADGRAHLAPTLVGLSIVDAAELERDEPIEVGVVAEVEARASHAHEVAAPAPGLTRQARGICGDSHASWPTRASPATTIGRCWRSSWSPAHDVAGVRGRPRSG